MNRKQVIFWSFMLAVLSCAGIVSCSGADGDEPYLQNNVPTAQITAPTSSPTYLAYYSAITNETVGYFSATATGEDEPLSYRWNWDEIQSDTTDLIPGFVTISISSTTTYQITFTCTDVTGDSASSQLALTLVGVFAVPVSFKPDVSGNTTQLISGHKVVNFDDGSYVATGITGEGKNKMSMGSASNIWAMCVSYDGTVVWNTELGGEGSDDIKVVMKANDGGYLVVGESNSFNTNSDIWLVKLNESGMVEWSRVYDSGDVDTFTWVMPLADGYVICGDSSNVYAWGVRTDNFGRILEQSQRASIRSMETSVPSLGQ